MVIYHSIIPSKIHFQQGRKLSSKPIDVMDQHESKGKTSNATNSYKPHGNNNKGNVKEKGYHGKAKISLDLKR